MNLDDLKEYRKRTGKRPGSAVFVSLCGNVWPQAIDYDGDVRALHWLEVVVCFVQPQLHEAMNVISEIANVLPKHLVAWNVSKGRWVWVIESGTPWVHECVPINIEYNRRLKDEWERQSNSNS